MKKVSSENIILYMVLSAICIAAVGLCIITAKRAYDRDAELKRLEGRMEEYRTLITTEFPKFCQKTDSSVNGTYTAEGFPELVLKYSGEKKEYYDLMFNYAVTLHVDSAFDRLDDRSKYEMLEDLYPKIEPAHEDFLREYFPEFYDNPEWEVVKNLFIGYDIGEYEAYIQTPEHLYQYSRNYEDLFLVDGENNFLMDEKSHWNKKRGKWGTHGQGTTGTGSGNKSGKRGSGGNGFSNADDYSDEYAEYYMEEGYDYDDAYDEAYDEWEE